MSDVSSRRWRRVQERRRRILAAAAGVFARKGYSRATTKEIAAEADVSEGTIYNYFRSKRDLLISIVREVAPGLFSEDMLLSDASEMRSRFVEGFEYTLAFVSENREMLSVLASEMWHNEEILQEWVIVGGQELLDRAAKKIGMAIEAGELRRIDPAMAARVILSVGLGLALPIIVGVLELPTQAERRQLAESVVDLLQNGMLARRASARDGQEGKEDA